MTTNGNAHPGRSVDFLSRLHDGDLAPAERARFEAHRAHCAECRRAAIEFEDALAMFRSARSAPPRADLAARILRKVQSTNRPRVPFPLGFRIDLGWAGLLATALLVLMIMTPLAVRRSETVSPADVPARESVPAPPAVANAPASDQQSAPPELSRQARRPVLSDTKPDARREVSNERKEEEAPPSIAAARPGSAGVDRTLARSSREKAAARSAAPAAPAAPVAPAAQVAPPPAEDARAAAAAPETGRIGGEGEGNVSSLAKAAPWKLTIEPIDGFGPAPALLSRSVPAGAGAGGLEFVLLVDSQGAVRKVSAHSPRSERSLDELHAESDGGDEVAASIAKLRFAPGNRPRRLLVRVN